MTQSTDASIPCENCTRTGFPILFTRYGIAYSATKQEREALKQMTPKAPMQPVPGLSTVSSNVRMLRAGYLYLYLEGSSSNAWKAYAIHEHGYVSEFAIESPASARAQKACQRSSHAGNASLVWLEDAEHIKTVWYLFNPDPLDTAHLYNVIRPHRSKLMKQFSPQKWLAGDHTQAHSTTVSALEINIFEYAALTNEKLQRCSDALMYGLMGSNAQERGWGDYEEAVEYEKPSMNPSAAMIGVTETDTRMLTRRQPGYAEAHGPRLQQIKDFLIQNKGAVLACDDALGIAQELGHMQNEAQLLYTRWQVEQAPGYHYGVTNEWVFQSALGAQSMQELVKQGAAQKVKDRRQMREQMRLPEYDAPFERELMMEAAQRRRNGEAEEDILRAMQAKRAQKQREKDKARQEILDRLEHQEMQQAAQAGDAEFEKLFDVEGAQKIFAEQARVHENAQTVLRAIGRDQVAVLKSDGFAQAMGRYSDKEDAINQPGGGADLSLQLAQAMTGTETNAEGQKLLAETELLGENVLGRLLSLNQEDLRLALAALEAEVQSSQQKLQAATAPQDVSLSNKLANQLRLSASHISLLDNGLSHIDAAQATNAPALLRKTAWASHIYNLLGARTLAMVKSVPASQLEGKMVHSLAVGALATLGRTAQQEIATLRTDVQENAQRIALRAKKLQAVGNPETRKGREQALQRARRGAPGTRVAMLGSLFDLCVLVSKGGNALALQNGRSAAELGGQLLQLTGGFYALRAQAYQETIFKGARGVNIYKYKALQQGLDSINLAHLRGLRSMAFRFLGPAALVFGVLDSIDAYKSAHRGQYAVAVAQMASAVGTVFTAGGFLAGTIALGAAPATAGAWAATAALLGVVGAVLVIGSIAVLMVLSEDEWITWLRDIPLNKARKNQKPIHDDLQETLQKFASVKENILPA